MSFTDISQAAVAVLSTADARAKAETGRRAAAAWRFGHAEADAVADAAEGRVHREASLMKTLAAMARAHGAE